MPPLNLNSVPFRVGTSLPMRGGLQPRATPVRGMLLNRQSRFDMRSAKRWGDASLFLIPSPWLWLEEGCVPTPDGPPICGAPPIAGLWP